MENTTEKNNKEIQERQENADVDLFLRRAIEAAEGDRDKAMLSIEIAELKNENDFLKDLNTQMANTYTDVFNSFPNTKEFKLLLDIINSKDDVDIIKACNDFDNYFSQLSEEEKNQRLFQLRRFNTALIMIENNDIRIKPKKYVDPDEVQADNE